MLHIAWHAQHMHTCMHARVRSRAYACMHTRAHAQDGLQPQDTSDQALAGAWEAASQVSRVDSLEFQAPPHWSGWDDWR